jgi:signal transduction histidine kinase
MIGKHRGERRSDGHGRARLSGGRIGWPQLATAGEWSGWVRFPEREGWTAPWLSERAVPAAILVCGALAASLVGYVTAQNPMAAPAHVAVALRVAIVVTLIVAGTYALIHPAQERMGRLLVAAGFLSCLWLLNGSRDSLVFSIGVAAAGVATPLFYHLLLAHPGGRAPTQVEILLVAVFAVLFIGSWEFTWLTSAHPPAVTPLLRCEAHCPHNAFFLGTSSATRAVRSLCLTLWVAAGCGTFLLLLRRARLASPPLRRSITPTGVVSMFSMLFLIGFLISPTPKTQTADVFGYLYIGTAIAIPLAIVLGLGMERQFMGEALARFMDQLAGAAPSRVQALMADILHDPTLTIAYRRPRRSDYVDGAGAPLAIPFGDSARAVAAVERDGRPVASVLYDPALADQEAFVRAAGAAAALRLQELQLEADLKASMADLARSRRRLVDAADAERQRIERDLHDGAQQHLVGMRLKLELAADAIRHDRERGERMLAEIGVELDEALEELRALAQGVYPPLLAAHGLGEALKSAARRSSVPMSLEVRKIRRHPAEIETAVYFCCREALQNIAKHAGREAVGRLGIWEQGGGLHFEVSDSGVGFSGASAGSGILNMRDRVEAVGGSLEVRSRASIGTIVEGSVPVPAARSAPPEPVS